jgi:hypothetical protein
VFEKVLGGRRACPTKVGTAVDSTGFVFLVHNEDLPLEKQNALTDYNYMLAYM